MSHRFSVTLALAGPALAAALSPVAGRGQSAEPTLLAPPGFHVEPIARELPSPTGLAFGPDGRLYVALREGGRVVSLTVEGANSEVGHRPTIIDGLSGPSDLAFRGDELWVLDARRLIRARVRLVSGEIELSDVRIDELAAPGAPAASTPAPAARAATSMALVPGLDGVLVAVATTCDRCAGDDRGAILRLGPGVGESESWARGFRHVSGMAVQPGTGVLWATEAGRLDLGSGLPVDEVNTVVPGRHYGWPYCFGNRIPAPEYADPARCDRTEPPVLSFPTGSVPRDIVFYTGAAFPADYRGDAFVALGGTAMGTFFSGFRVLRVRFDDGRPTATEDFVRGWLGPTGPLGQPTRLAVGPDGALYVGDEPGGRVWRVAYVADGSGGGLTRAGRARRD